MGRNKYSDTQDINTNMQHTHCQAKSRVMDYKIFEVWVTVVTDCMFGFEREHPTRNHN